MYWYIKYPLIVILVLCLLGITGFIWRSCDRRIPEKETGGPGGGEEVVVPGKPVVVQPPVEVPGGDGGMVAPVVQPVSGYKAFCHVLTETFRNRFWKFTIALSRQINAYYTLPFSGRILYFPIHILTFACIPIFMGKRYFLIIIIKIKILLRNIFHCIIYIFKFLISV